MSFERFVTRYTVTTVLIFSLWDKRMPQIRYRGFEHLRFPFVQAAEMHGFINAFLGLNEFDQEHVHLLFNKSKALSPWQPHVVAPTFSINETMISCGDFREISYQDDLHIVYKYEIPDEFKMDVQNFTGSRYDMASDKILRNVFISEPEIPQENVLSTSLMADNIPYHVMKKSTQMEDMIFESLGSKPEKTSQYFKLFNQARECLVPEKHLQKLKSNSKTENNSE